MAAINAVLAARPIPNAGVTAIATGVYPITRRDTLASFKLDHTLNASNTLAFRYTYGKSVEANAGGVGIGGLVAESGGGGQDGTDQSFLGSWTQVLSPALLGEARLQVAPRALTQYANDTVGPRVSISGVATWGRNTNFPVILDETTTQGSYTLSWQRGSHFFKAGGDVTHIAATSSFPVSFAGSFTFGSLAAFTAGTPTTFTQGFGNPQIDLPDTLYSAFAQDSWSVSDRLTLVYGLRYDYDAQPQNVPRDPSNPIEAPLDDGIHRDGNNVSPRAGVHLGPRRRRAHAHPRRLRPLLRQGVPAGGPQRAAGAPVDLAERRQRRGAVRQGRVPGERSAAARASRSRGRASTCRTRAWRSRSWIRSASASSGSSGGTGRPP